MSLNLNGKVALVTGGSKGIGAGIAKKLAANGASVIVNYANSKDEAEKVVSQIISDGGKAKAIKASVNSAAEITALFETAKDTFGNIDILVNNAGIYAFSPLDAFSEEDYKKQFDINVLGLLLVSKEALKHFPESGGSIINISSVVSTAPTANSVIYSATKGAVDTITKALAVELAPRKIRVNTVAPGPVETEGFHDAGFAGSDFINAIVERTPLNRLGQPDDIARVVAFLASEDAGWVTGERISAAGGLQ